MKWELRKADGEVLMTWDEATMTYSLPNGESIHDKERPYENWPNREFWFSLESGTKWVKVDKQ